MKQLNASLIENLNRPPERVVQFGEGNFLRGFIDWMFHQMNQKGLFNGSVVAIQPTPHGKVLPKLEAQNYLYTVALRGIDHQQTVDQTEVITSISRGINPYSNWSQVLELAKEPTIQFVFSNTTEAGLTYQKESYDGTESPLSFPGKLTAFLYDRFQHFKGEPNAGLLIFPCELVEANGEQLKSFVIKHSHDFGFSDAFREWVENHNAFYNTLVDRIVTGYPKEDIDLFRERLHYDDQLLTVGEPFHLFVIEGPASLENQLPFKKAGLHIEWSEIKPFRDLKVRILNGIHTVMYALGVFNGKKTVLEAMQDPQIRPLLDVCLNEEICPVLEASEAEKRAFANSVIERFSNPYNKHQLTDLGMNGLNKFKVRCLPTILEYYDSKKECPEVLTLALAATLLYFRQDHAGEDDKFFGKWESVTYPIREDVHSMEQMNRAWSAYDGSEDALQMVTVTLLGEALWGQDLNRIPQLTQKISHYLNQLIQEGVKETLSGCLIK